MQDLSDTTLRATLRALAGRIGLAEPAAGLKAARGEASAAWEATETRDETRPEPCRRAAAEERRLALLRANAHAAYASVQGAHRAALDLALSVYETELRDLRARCDAHGEMLKTIRLYARDGEIRALAARGLDGCPEILAARLIAEAGCPRESGCHG